MFVYWDDNVYVSTRSLDFIGRAKLGRYILVTGSSSTETRPAEIVLYMWKRIISVLKALSHMNLFIEGRV